MEQKSLIKRLTSNPIVQTFLIYISGGWIMLEMTDYFINNYGLNERARDILLIILLAGLPVAIILAWLLGREKGSSEERSKHKETAISQGISKRKLWFFIPGTVILLLLLASGTRYLYRKNKIEWATGQAINELWSLMGDRKRVAAFNVVNEALKYAPDDPQIKDFSLRVIDTVTFLTDPEGVDIYAREYAGSGQEYKYLGTTPIDIIEMPGYTFYEFIFCKEDYDTTYGVFSTQQDTVFRKLFKPGEIPEGMVHVYAFSRDFTEGIFAPKRDFFIDKYEVSNRQFKRFVDSGGYRKPEYWKNDFMMDGQTLTWKEAMSYFTDKTGRPGPATWKAGTYPAGQDEYPVSGVSWYEATAYAAFVGKDLPTWYHWESAAGFYFNPFDKYFGDFLIPLSNMKKTGPSRCGSYGGVDCFGLYDMAGNVREWCWNETQDGRTVMGGAWNDVSYIYTSTNQAPAFDRSPRNGFRCVEYRNRDDLSDTIFDQISSDKDRRDYYTEEPVSDEIYQAYKRQFSYDKSDLNSTLELRMDSFNFCVVEKVSFQAAYEDERMIAYLFLPKQGKPPYQALMFFPGSNAVLKKYFDFDDFRWFGDFLPMNNIALVWPIYKGTYDRYEDIWDIHMPEESHTYTEYLVKWIKDYSRTVDYLETRQDIDTSKIGFYGHSWGGMMGAIIPAIEERTKLSVIVSGGLNNYSHAYPEADLINYVRHVKVPTIMLHGKYDTDLRFETDAMPMYEFLGTPAEDKVMKVYETGHFVPKSEVIKETLNFMEKYFGPAMN